MFKASMSHRNNVPSNQRRALPRSVAALFALAFGAVGCGAAEGEAMTTEEAELAAEGDAEFGDIESAFSQSDCASETADTTRTGYFYITTPQTYNTCYKGYVIDANDYKWNGCDGEGLYTEWADAIPTTQAACEGSHVRMIVYTKKKADGTWETASAIDQRQYGVWSPADDEFAAFCNIPRLYQRMTLGADYRIAVTARNSSNSTRKVSVHGYMGCLK